MTNEASAPPPPSQHREPIEADREAVQAIQDCWFNRDEMLAIITAHRLAFSTPAASDHIADVSKMVAPAVSDAEGWRPIATAPKDDTVILVTDGRSVYAASHTLRVHGADHPWVLFDGAFGHQPFGCCDREDDCRIEVNGWPETSPTHWMPLPKAGEGDHV